MKDEFGGSMDLIERIVFVGEVVGELELEPSSDTVPKFGLKTTGECSTLLRF